MKTTKIIAIITSLVLINLAGNVSAQRSANTNTNAKSELNGHRSTSSTPSSTHRTAPKQAEQKKPAASSHKNVNKKPEPQKNNHVHMNNSIHASKPKPIFEPIAKTHPHNHNQPIYYKHIGSAKMFYIEGHPYYYSNGAFYQYITYYGYMEIEMPNNIFVTTLPYYANTIWFQNIVYYEIDGLWFQPVVGGYLLVKQPKTGLPVYRPAVMPTISYRAVFNF